MWTDTKELAAPTNSVRLVSGGVFPASATRGQPSALEVTLTVWQQEKRCPRMKRGRDSRCGRSRYGTEQSTYMEQWNLPVEACAQFARRRQPRERAISRPKDSLGFDMPNLTIGLCDLSPACQHASIPRWSPKRGSSGRCFSTAFLTSYSQQTSDEVCVGA